MGSYKQILTGFFSILVTYFSSRVINLTLIPIFNDEAIYLDWGWRETHVPGLLYYSLYDNKQPLLMWFFGMFESIFPDPLFAGRLVSVICGAITLGGIYRLAKELYGYRAAFIASLFYITIPIFVMFDRLALMESAISAVGVWSLYFLIRFYITNRPHFMVLLGIALGVGFFIKSSSLMFLSAFILIALFFAFKIKEWGMLKKGGIVILSILLVDSMLLLNAEFWSTLPKNALYSLTLGEVFRLPLGLWAGNFVENTKITFIFLTPFLLIISAFSVVKLFRTKSKVNLIFTLWLLSPLLLSSIVIRYTQQRYIVSFLPLVCILIAYLICEFNLKKSQLAIVVFSLILIPSLMSLMLIFRPKIYFMFFGKFINSSFVEYYTSGQNINDVVNYLKMQSVGKNTQVGMAVNIGNPESAIVVNFQKSKNIKTSYFDSILFDNAVLEKDCLRFQQDFFFVSRDEQQAGLNKFFQEVKRFKNPYQKTSIGIYKLKSNCQGSIADLSFK